MARPLTLGFVDVDKPVARNPNYIARLTTNDASYGQDELNKAKPSGPVLELPLPEQFNFAIAAEYQAPFAQGIIGSQGIQNFARMAGMSNLVTQGLTAQVWQGSSEVSFTLTFELYAENDAEIDVVQPIKRLMMMTLPGKEPLTGLLTPPGPTIDFAASAGANGSNSITEYLSNLVSGNVKAPALRYKGVISLEIGNFIRFNSVVITNVAANYSSMFDKRGMPMFASVDVSFLTFVVPVKSDVDNMFIGSRPTSLK